MLKVKINMDKKNMKDRVKRKAETLKYNMLSKMTTVFSERAVEDTYMALSYFTRHMEVRKNSNKGSFRVKNQGPTPLHAYKMQATRYGVYADMYKNRKVFIAKAKIRNNKAWLGHTELRGISPAGAATKGYEKLVANLPKLSDLD